MQYNIMVWSNRSINQLTGNALYDRKLKNSVTNIAMHKIEEKRRMRNLTLTAQLSSLCKSPFNLI